MAGALLDRKRDAVHRRKTAEVLFEPDSFQRSRHKSVSFGHRDRLHAGGHSAKEPPTKAAHKSSADPDALTPDQHNHNEDETDPELPILRGEIGNPILHQLE